MENRHYLLVVHQSRETKSELKRMGRSKEQKRERKREREREKGNTEGGKE